MANGDIIEVSIVDVEAFKIDIVEQAIDVDVADIPIIIDLVEDEPIEVSIVTEELNIDLVTDSIEVEVSLCGGGGGGDGGPDNFSYSVVTVEVIVPEFQQMVLAGSCEIESEGDLLLDGDLILIT